MVALGVRVFIAAALTGFLGLLALKGWNVAASVAGIIPHSKIVTYPLSVLPLFILIGFLAFYAGLTSRLFEAARRWVGWVPGGLAVATVFATAGFAAVSGASTATAAVFSRVAIPDMLRNHYDRKLTAGVIAAGGTLASLIPPSCDPRGLRDHRRAVGRQASSRRILAGIGVGAHLCGLDHRDVHGQAQSRAGRSAASPGGNASRASPARSPYFS